MSREFCHQWDKFMVTYASMEEFREWLQAELDRLDWRRAKLARETGLSESTISRWFADDPLVRRSPGPDACKKLARALGHPVAFVYRMAGWYPNYTMASSRYEVLMFFAEQMTEDQYQNMITYGQFILTLSPAEKPVEEENNHTSARLE